MLTRFAVSLLALATGAFAHDAPAAPMQRTGHLKPEADSALDGLRGGFVTAGGLTFDIGITTSTYINGQLALRSTIATGPGAPTAPTAPTGPTAPAATGAGSSTGGAGGPTVAVTVQTSGPTSTDGANPPATSASVDRQLSTEAGPGPLAPAPQAQSSAGPDSVGSGGTSGQTVTATTADGQTTVIQNPSQLINLVTNAANNQDIRLDTQVNLVLPGFDSVQHNQLLSAMGMKMGADGSFGIVSSLPH